MVLLQRMHYGIIALGSVLVFSMLSYCIYHVLQPRSVRVGCDNLFSCDFQEKLSSHVYRKKSMRALGASSLLKELQADFPAVSSVAIAYKGNQTAYVKLQAAEPLLLIKHCLNGSICVLTKQGFMMPEAYSEQILATKDTLLVYDGFAAASEQELLTLASVLSHDYFVTYKITWHGTDKIVLQPAVYPHLSIVADTKTVTRHELLAYAIAIYSTNYQDKPMKVDIRFGNFMVCARLRGDV